MHRPLCRVTLAACLLFWLVFWLASVGSAQAPAASAGPGGAPPGGAAPARTAAAADRGERRSGDFGVGGEATLGGTTGIQARLMLSESVGLQLTLGLDVFSLTPRGTSNAGTGTDVRVGAVAHVRFYGWDGGQAAFLAGVDFESISASDPSGTKTTGTVFGASAGLFAEVFIEPYLSLHAQSGLRVGFRGGDAEGFFVGALGDLFTGFGFTFWLG